MHARSFQVRGSGSGHPRRDGTGGDGGWGGGATTLAFQEGRLRMGGDVRVAGNVSVGALPPDMDHLDLDWTPPEMDPVHGAWQTFVPGTQAVLPDLMGTAEFGRRLRDLTASFARIYVAPEGDDTAAGDSAAAPVRTLAKAAQMARQRLADSLAQQQQDPAPADQPPTRSVSVVIVVAAGEYPESLPIALPPNTAVVGDGLRSVVLRPATPADARRDFFHVGGGCYLYGLRFVGLRAPAFCVAFPCALAAAELGAVDGRANNAPLGVASVTKVWSPTGYASAPEVLVEAPGDGTGARAAVRAVLGLDGAIARFEVLDPGEYAAGEVPLVSVPPPAPAVVLASPYVQNCSSVTGPFDTHGAAVTLTVADEAGAQVQVPRPPPYDAEDVDGDGSGRRVDPAGAGGGIRIDGHVCHPDSPLRSFVADAFTQVNQGGPGHLIANAGYAQFVSCFTTFCSVGYKAVGGGSANLSNSVSDFGDVGLTAEGYELAPYATGLVASPMRVAGLSVTSPGSGYTAVPGIELQGGELASGAVPRVTGAALEGTGLASAGTVTEVDPAHPALYLSAPTAAVDAPQGGPDGQSEAARVAVATSLVGVVTFGTFAGASLPFVLRKFGVDPASASAPFVATLVDVTGLIIYFTIAAVILRIAIGHALLAIAIAVLKLSEFLDLSIFLPCATPSRATDLSRRCCS